MTTLSIKRSASAEGFVPSNIANKVAVPAAPVNAFGLITRAWQWINTKRAARANTKRLQVAETIALGEKRFVSVVNVGDRQFLIGGGPTNVSLIAELGPATTFEQALKLSAVTAVPAAASTTRRKRLPSSPVANNKFLTTSTFTTSINGSMTGEAIADDVIASLTAPKVRKSSPRRTATHKVAPVVAAKLAPAPSEFTFSTALATTPRPRRQAVMLPGETA